MEVTSISQALLQTNYTTFYFTYIYLHLTPIFLREWKMDLFWHPIQRGIRKHDKMTCTLNRTSQVTHTATSREVTIDTEGTSDQTTKHCLGLNFKKSILKCKT